jgi:hypothetical protein
VQTRFENKAVSLLQHHVMIECWAHGGKDSCTAGQHVFGDILCFISWKTEFFGLLHVCVCVYFCEFITCLPNYVEIIRIIYLKVVEIFTCSSYCISFRMYMVLYVPCCHCILYNLSYIQLFETQFCMCYFVLRQYIFVTKSVSCLGSIMKRFPGEFIVPRNTWKLPHKIWYIYPKHFFCMWLPDGQ